MRASELADWVRDARAHTLALVADLSDEQLRVPRMGIINPVLWEIGHAAWFQEKWVLRDGGDKPSIQGDADRLYDSIAIDHDIRWDLPLATREGTLAYMREVHERVLQRLESVAAESLEQRDAYLNVLSVYHEDMHCEALTYTRQTLAYAPPKLGHQRVEPPPAIGLEELGDVEVPGGSFMLGSPPDEPFVFDNEKWEHGVDVRPFAISRTAVTQGRYASFVDQGGYENDDLWCDHGLRWRAEVTAKHPVYWRRSRRGWERRDFDTWTPLEPNKAMIHVNWHEARAYCRWADRRLPTEIEWEVAAAGEPAAGGGLSERKRRYPWGDRPPEPGRANLDWRWMGCVDVTALPDGDSAFGCRQMIGNTWEWTESTFGPFPGFSPDAYKEYSSPWFDTHKVLRGGCFATRGRLIRNMLRNFYTPDRRDISAGFRTCANR